MPRSAPVHGILRLGSIPLALLLTAPAGADWLVTLRGELIETEGPWTIEGEVLTYTGVDGEERALALDEVDLEGSEETTALRVGRPYVPSTREAAAGPKITFYMTRWCRECRKTRQLLERLGVEFVEKNIESDQEAFREFRDLAGGRSEVPVVDVDGRLVRGYKPGVIRKRLRELERREAEGREAAGEG